MHALIVFCHPEPASFNATLKNVAIEALTALGHTTEVSDLHADRFDPVEKAEHYANPKDPLVFDAAAEQRHASETAAVPPDVQREIERLERADLVLLQFPLWWHAQPAMLKGWFDRVFLNGGLYTSTMRYDRGYFCGKRAMCSVTTGAPEAAFEGSGRGGNMEVMLWPIQYSLYYMGFSVLPPVIAHGVQSQANFVRLEGREFDQHLEHHLATLAERLEQWQHDDPLPFPGWEDWDEAGHAKTTMTTGSP
ncbi:MAG: NAD(P)H-dependent oxidoreductase [Pseudomonadota bacterium]